MKRPVCGIASLAAVLVLAQGCAERTARVGFRFDEQACVLRPGAMERFGELLTDEERRTIRAVARAEVIAAFAAVRLDVTDDASAFWRIAVVRSLPTRTTRAVPRAGESVALGILGGGGVVACDVVARKAIAFAPAGTTRSEVVEAIGRGVGRTAVHEIVHQVLGADSGHNDADPAAYEHGSSDRAAQYYGTLRWTTSLPALQRKLGARVPS
ncbi:MAG: hypothetical protein AB7H96_14965 [Vicinamibacterales bacterium]